MGVFCKHAWHEVGEYKKRIDEGYAYIVRPLDGDKACEEYFVLYCPLCDKTKKFRSKKDYNLELAKCKVRRETKSQ